jgi:membrane protein implicated in regulation of membrane protease activity
MKLALVWIAMALLFAVGEVATVALFAAFLSVGAVGAAIVALLGLGPLWQAVAFVVVSLIGVLIARPWVMGLLMRRANVETVSGAHSMIGETAIVVRSSGGADQTGHVRLQGENWPARTRGASLKEGARVQIVDIEGSTLIVEPASEDDPS